MNNLPDEEKRKRVKQIIDMVGNTYGNLRNRNLGSVLNRIYKDGFEANKVFVSHGMVTHLIEAKCKFCEKVQKEFEQDLKSGKVAKILKKNKPKNFYDLPDEERKKIMKEAFEEAEKEQRKLVEKYNSKIKRKDTINKHWTKKRAKKEKRFGLKKD